MSFPQLRIGFTGHRTVPEPERIKTSLQSALARLEQLVPGASLSGVSSGALGADLLFAEVLLARNLPWKLLLPFASNRFFNPDDFPGNSLARAHTLARQAADIVQVTSDSLPDDLRRESFLECSLCTVDECDVLIAVWDGQRGRPGGTESAVAHARQLGRPLIYIDPTNGISTEERLELLSASAQAAVQPDVPSEIEAEFKAHTHQAKLSRPRAINLNLLLVGLHQAATLVAIIALIWAESQSAGSVHSLDPAASFKVLVLIVALLLPFWLKQKCHDWTKHRLQAEILRSVLRLWHLPEPARVFASVRLPVCEDFQADLLNRRKACPTGPALSVASFKLGYLEKHLTAQLEYYRQHARRARREHAWLHHLANACTGVAIALGLVVIFHWVGPADAAYRTLKLLSISLPLVSAAVLAAISARDLHRRLARYDDMCFFLQAARRRIELGTSWDQVTDAVVEVERRLLFEIWEWYSVTRYGSAH